MRKLNLLLSITILALTACNRENDSTLPGEFDDSKLATKLCNTVLKSKYIEDANGTRTYDHKETIFNNDGTCYAIRQLEIEYLDEDKTLCKEINYYYSRSFTWEYDVETNTLTTTDKQGNIKTATIVELDDEKIKYRGEIADEMLHRGLIDNQKGGNNVSLAYFADSSSWQQEELLSYDAHFRMLADENDNRLNKINNLIAEANGTIDDNLFTELLTSKALYCGTDNEGTESGCFYGDRGIYYSYNNQVYWCNTQVVGGPEPSTYIFMEDGTCRNCLTLTNDISDPYYGKNCFTEYSWSYDAENNTLHTGRSSAEVLYCDNNIAILKGEICRWVGFYDYCLFHIDFTTLDRENTLNKYNTEIVR